MMFWARRSRVAWAVVAVAAVSSGAQETVQDAVDLAEQDALLRELQARRLVRVRGTC